MTWARLLHSLSACSALVLSSGCGCPDLGQCGGHASVFLDLDYEWESIKPPLTQEVTVRFCRDAKCWTSTVPRGEVECPFPEAKELLGIGCSLVVDEKRHVLVSISWRWDGKQVNTGEVWSISARAEDGRVLASTGGTVVLGHERFEACDGTVKDCYPVLGFE